jgi:hypothetical protein
LWGINYKGIDIMSREETHFYIYTCDVCGKKDTVQWADASPIDTYYYGRALSYPADGYPTCPRTTHSIEACEICCSKLDLAIADKIKELKTN